MQATLGEVELSASGATRVFGPDHDRKLAELRTSQIALAQAWARSEADEAIETGGGGSSDPRVAMPGADVGAGSTKVDAGAALAASAGIDTRPPSNSGLSAGQDRFGAKLQQETEVDILRARKRREANDRYFQRVNQGVLDVVSKLEEVAVAMRAVEQESKDIWGDGEAESIAGSGNR
jgi:hypothetical protein